MNKYFMNKRGMTLVEVLLALTVSTIVIGTISFVFVSIYKTQENTQNHIDLRQEANMIVTKLRTIHVDENYKLCYDNGQIFIDDHMNSLASENIHITGNENSGTKVFFENDGNQFTVLNTCNNGNEFEVNIKEPLEITLNISDEDNNTFEIDTVIDRVAMADVVTPPENEEEEEDEEEVDEEEEENEDNNDEENNNEEEEDKEAKEYCSKWDGLNIFKLIEKILYCIIFPWITELIKTLAKWIRRLIESFL